MIALARLLCFKPKQREEQRKLGLAPQSILQNQHDGIEQSSKPESNTTTTTTTNISPNFVCDICVETTRLKYSFDIQGCNHFYCHKCIVKYVESQLENNVTSIVCPVPDCRGVLDPEYCRPILPNKVFDWWGKALCERAITGSDDRVKCFYCPFKDCSALLIHDGPEDIKRSLCPHCKREFCVKCKVPWHMEFDCDEFQKMSKTGEYKEYEMVMKLAEKKNWKRCPNCKMYVGKTWGCNFMKCRCTTAFCYKCGTILDARGSHFCPICKRTRG